MAIQAKKQVGRPKAQKKFQFTVFVTDDDGVFSAAVSEVTGNIADELNVKEYVETYVNAYFNFLDELPEEDEDDFDDEEEIEEIPAPKPRTRRK